MSKEDKSHNLLTGLVESITESLVRERFAPSRQEGLIGKWAFYKWHRSSGFKCDVMTMLYPKLDPYFVEPQLEVLLLSSGEDVDLDGTTVSYLAGRSPAYYFPSVLLSMRTRRYIKKVVSDIEEALPWFKLFETPEACLMRLQSGQTVHGNASGAVARRSAILKALIERAPTKP